MLWFDRSEYGDGACVAFGRNRSDLPVSRDHWTRGTLAPMCRTIPGCFAIMPAALMTSRLRPVRLMRSGSLPVPDPGHGSTGGKLPPDIPARHVR